MSACRFLAIPMAAGSLVLARLCGDAFQLVWLMLKLLLHGGLIWCLGVLIAGLISSPLDGLNQVDIFSHGGSAQISADYANSILSLCEYEIRTILRRHVVNLLAQLRQTLLASLPALVVAVAWTPKTPPK
jgi:hypothetical protein